MKAFKIIVLWIVCLIICVFICTDSHLLGLLIISLGIWFIVRNYTYRELEEYTGYNKITKLINKDYKEDEI